MTKKKRVVYSNRPWEATGICSGCRLCELWCSLSKNGSFNPRRSRVRIVELGTGIDVPVTCQQCQDPACQASCKFEALSYHEKLKIVVVDEEKCTGCRACVGACPYGIITMDPVTHKAIKCDLCNGEEPVCVSICPSNVLALVDDVEAGEVNRRRLATLLASDDQFQRYMPGGEEPIQKKLEKRG
ncbi:MAG: 4Fe-4S dicluster domain-containing protein [Deltaproteobacteria bacterium]|jgi:anaerobic carbon-monoxide dehydrogenase iron sulfur subunit|nr:4Fe-4S dicluster domain-containing protein [Deltaproteobacteria bacterium]